MPDPEKTPLSESTNNRLTAQRYLAKSLARTGDSIIPEAMDYMAAASIIICEQEVTDKSQGEAFVEMLLAYHHIDENCHITINELDLFGIINHVFFEQIECARISIVDLFNDGSTPANSLLNSTTETVMDESLQELISDQEFCASFADESDKLRALSYIKDGMRKTVEFMMTTPYELNC